MPLLYVRRCGQAQHWWGVLLCSSVERLIGGSRPTSLLAEINIRQWAAEVSCPGTTRPDWLACWVDIPDRSASSSSKEVQVIGDIHDEGLGVVLSSLILALRAAFDANNVMISGVLGVLLLRLGFCRHIAERAPDRAHSIHEMQRRMEIGAPGRSSQCGTRGYLEPTANPPVRPGA